MRLTNTTDISLSLAVWLAEDRYDHDERENAISVTTLLKPTRQIVLSSRIPKEDESEDISSRIASSLGTAIHDAIERAWKDNYKKSLMRLGYPSSVVQRILINPTPEDFKKVPRAIPVYMEVRSEKEILGFIVTGKFDFVGQGKIDDFKSTGVYSFMMQSNDWKYMMQGSLYRWLNPKIVTESTMNIQFIFTDWSKKDYLSQKDKGYPSSRIAKRSYNLLSIGDTEEWVKTKLNEIIDNWDKPENELPRCADEDLWRGNTVYKYYKSGKVTARSTKNFDNYHDADRKCAEDACGGIVVEVKGQVRACEYCSGFELCTQKEEFIAEGSLII